MKLFFVTYDLLKPGKNYDQLYAALERLGAKRVLLSVWALRGNYTAAALRDSLKQHMDSNDRLLVIESADWAAWNAMIKIADV